MTPLRAFRKDANHEVIADAFRRLGWQWYDTYQVAQYLPGFPDGMAVKSWCVLLVEIKGERGRLTEEEKRFHSLYAGPLAVVRTIEDVKKVTEIWSRAILGGSDDQDSA